MSDTHQKTCTKCLVVKSYEQFSRHRTKKDGRRSWCKQCESIKLKAYREENREYLQSKMRDWQKANPEKRRANQKRITEARTKYVLERKDKPCVDCGLRLPPECMEYDHVRGMKEFGLHKAAAYSIKRIQLEIDKCEVRCPNCHRLRHYHIRQNLKEQIA